MPIHPNSLANLKPIPYSKENPAVGGGRKIGSRNRKNIVREWLDVASKAELDGKEYANITQADKLVLSMIREANNGNVAAFNTLMDSVFGKVPNVSVTEQPVKYNMAAYSTEQLEAMAAILANPANPDNNIQEAEVVE